MKYRIFKRCRCQPEIKSPAIGLIFTDLEAAQHAKAELEKYLPEARLEIEVVDDHSDEPDYS